MTHTVGERADERQPRDRSPGAHPDTPISPPTARVISILEHLVRAESSDGTGAMTLAEIVRATGSSRATAHAVVGELAAHGWVVRDEDTGAFRIGPAFVTLGRTAAAGDHVTDWAATAMRRLSHTLGMPGFVARRTDPGTVIVVDHSGDTTATPWFTPGRRMPLRPPNCREFMAWAPAAEQHDWIAQAPAGTADRLTQALVAIRDRGYSIERMTTDHAQVVAALDSIDGVSDRLRSRMGDLLSELTTIDYLPEELTGDITAVTVGAPIFGADGDVIASIVMCPGTTIGATEFTRVGDATRSAADQVSAYLR